jgi:hypothetical protein
MLSRAKDRLRAVVPSLILLKNGADRMGSGIENKMGLLENIPSWLSQ